MFRFHKTLDVITLFHKPTVASSLKVLSILKRANSQAGESATEDQASDHTAQTAQSITQEFELNVTEDQPTPDQLNSILDSVGPKNAGLIVKGAKDGKDAVRKLRESGDNFLRPLTVDWNNGRVVPGDNESEILKMLATLPKQ